VILLFDPSHRLLFGKNKQQTVFFIIIGTILIYFYTRQRRERAKRDEHREKVWQFKDMQRSGMRPTLKTDGKSGAPIQIAYPVLMSEAAMSPRYPTRAFRWE
jgi:hypothetical protein